MCTVGMFIYYIYICMYVHTRECMNSLLINYFALHIIEILFASKFPQAVIFRLVPGRYPV